MKLNYKRTVCVGFTFFLICAFWQAYDNSIPLLLTHKFHMSQTASGAIMALDNVLALFMLPLFGTISDRSRSRWGRRTPFILWGTVAAAAAFALLPFLNTLAMFIVCLLAALIAMAVFRSPAVALMPDVTVKPLRSRANAVINLLGSAGSILVLVFGFLFGTSRAAGDPDVFKRYFVAVAVIMIAALVLFMATVREKRFVHDMHEESRAYGIVEEDGGEEPGGERAGLRLSPAARRSMIFLLVSVVFWSMAYNAISSKFSVYATEIIRKDYNIALITGQAAAVISYIPTGILASKIGRKKSVIAGVALLAAAFAVMSLLRQDSPYILMSAMFVLMGIGMASINVNSFPMIVEMCSEADTGRYTGFYYTASMAAQIITPMLSGFLMDRIGLTVLFPYAMICEILALITMQLVRHGDSRPKAKKGLEALEDM